MEENMKLNERQEILLSKLLSGELTKPQFASMRSNARRSNDITLSIQLAEVFEVYKYKVKNEEARKKKSEGT